MSGGGGKGPGNTERERVAQLAAATARAEEAEKLIGLGKEYREFHITRLEADLAIERAARVKAEAERDELERRCDTRHSRLATELSERLAAAEAEVARLKDVLHLDRSGLAAALNHVRDTARGYRWIPAGEWGSYDYTGQTMETLRKEIGWMLDGVEKTAAEALGKSGDLAHAECCGGEHKEIPVERENAALRERCKALEEAATVVVARIDAWVDCNDGSNGRRMVSAGAALRAALDAPAGSEARK